MLQRKPCPVLHRRDLQRALITSPLWALAPQHTALGRVVTLPGSLACHGLGCKSAAAKGERGQTRVEALHSLEPSREVCWGGGPIGKEPGLPPVGPDASLMTKCFYG